jgi:hypothetical protein
MFARAVPDPRHIAVFAVALAGASGLAGCGQTRQDASEPGGSYRVDVVSASFPAQQAIAGATAMRIRVRNRDQQTVPDIAVTVRTNGARPGDAPQAFAQSSSDSRLADPNRPVWVLDTEPKGGVTAYTNTWALGPLKPNQTKTFLWKVTAVKAGTYTLSYLISPGLTGKARLASGSHGSGTFKVTVADKPVPARVNDKGQVVRGQSAGTGNN